MIHGNANDRELARRMAYITRASDSSTSRKPHAPITHHGLVGTIVVCLVALAILYFGSRM